MTVCPHTGITIPECSCSVCLEAQLRRHRPGGGEAEIRVARTPRAARRRSESRRAA